MHHLQSTRYPHSSNLVGLTQTGMTWHFKENISAVLTHENITIISHCKNVLQFYFIFSSDTSNFS